MGAIFGESICRVIRLPASLWKKKDILFNTSEVIEKSSFCYPHYTYEETESTKR